MYCSNQYVYWSNSQLKYSISHASVYYFSFARNAFKKGLFGDETLSGEESISIRIFWRYLTRLFRSGSCLGVGFQCSGNNYLT